MSYQPQPDALRLAGQNEASAYGYPAASVGYQLHMDTATELRRLNSENEAQRKALRAYMDTISQFHHAMADAGWHPGRTDDLLTDIIKEKGKEFNAMSVQRNELLEALQFVMTATGEQLTTAFEQAQEAITKAIG